MGFLLLSPNLSHLLFPKTFLSFLPSFLSTPLPSFFSFLILFPIPVAQDKFSETTIGYRSGDVLSAELFSKLFDTPTFRVGVVEDVAGVSLCGALKNVVAIGAGFCDGLGWGDNAKGELPIVLGEREKGLLRSELREGSRGPQVKGRKGEGMGNPLLPFLFSRLVLSSLCCSPVLLEEAVRVFH